MMPEASALSGTPGRPDGGGRLEIAEEPPASPLHLRLKIYVKKTTVKNTMQYNKCDLIV